MEIILPTYLTGLLSVLSETIMHTANTVCDAEY